MQKEDVERYCLKTYGTEPDHPWHTYPDYEVFRHADTGKWYALVMDVPAERLGLKGTDIKWVLDVKCDRLLIDGLLQRPGFLPAYHMSKTAWISVLLDGQVAMSEVENLIDASFEATA